MILNELVKLTTLWTTGPRALIFFLFLHENVVFIRSALSRLVLGNPLLKSGRCLWRLSSSRLDHLNGVPLHLIGCRYHWWRLPSCCLVSAWRHPVSLALSCLVVTVQAECAGWVYWQQACALSSSLHQTQSLSLWHPVCPSFVLWHNQWDASVRSEDVSMSIWLRVGRWKTVLWSVVHVLYTSSKGGGHCCCTFLLLQSQSLLPRFVPTLALKSPRRMSLSVRGIAEITESRSS